MINNKESKGKVLFDNISQTALVKDKFAETMGLSYANTSYSLAGIDTNETTIQGKIHI